MTPYVENFSNSYVGCLGTSAGKPSCTWTYKSGADTMGVDWRVGQLDSSWYLYTSDYFRTSGGELIAHDVNEGVYFQPILNPELFGRRRRKCCCMSFFHKPMNQNLKSEN